MNILYVTYHVIYAVGKWTLFHFEGAAVTGVVERWSHALFAFQVHRILRPKYMSRCFHKRNDSHTDTRSHI